MALHENHLKRGLKSRHIQLIALGGAIGTGLFLGVAETVSMAGPSILLGYAVAGLIAFLIMRQLSEMMVDEPVAGSFSHFADKYCGRFAGFLTGWNYWVLYVLVSMAELSAVGIYVQYWFPEIPTWVSALGCFVFANAISMFNVRAFGETEFWFAVIKVVAIVAMILYGIFLLFSGGAGPQAGVANLSQHGGFFAHGVEGLVMSMAVLMFSFGGLEVIGITAAEADNPSKSIPKATNQALWRILVFYVGSLAVLLSLYPWNQIKPGASPFVLIFKALDAGAVAHVLNLVVLTAAVSVYNSCVYSNSRMLYGLAAQGHAPRALLKVNERGVPLVSLGVSAVATVICVAVNYALPGKALGMLMGLAVAGMIINWAMISWSHLRFRRAKAALGVKPVFGSPFYPVTNWICLAFLAGILVVMYVTPDLRASVYLIPLWLGVLGVAYRLRNQDTSKNHFDPHKSLMALAVVRLTLGLILFLSFGLALLIAINDRPQLILSYEGLNNALEIFKVPLGIAALLIPAIALLAANHRSEQSREQMRLAAEQNLFSNHFKHLEEFEDYCEAQLEDIKNDHERATKLYEKSNLKVLANNYPFPGHIHPGRRRALYRRIFPASLSGNYEISKEFFASFETFILRFYDLLECLGSAPPDDRPEFTAVLYDFVEGFSEANFIVSGEWRTQPFEYGGLIRSLPSGSVGGIIDRFIEAVSVLDNALQFDIRYEQTSLIKNSMHVDRHVSLMESESHRVIGDLAYIKNADSPSWKWSLNKTTLIKN